jgi:hypothetical protein
MSVGVVGSEITTGEDFKCLCAEAEFFIHPLVVCTGKEGHANFQEDRLCSGGGVSFTKGLASDAVGPTGALLKHGGIPCKVVMDHVTAVPMEVNSLLPHLSAYQDLGQEWSIETVEDAVAGGNHVAAAAFYQSNELLVAQACRLVEGSPGGSGIGNISAGGFQVFEENSDPLGHAFVLVGKVGEECPG